MIPISVSSEKKLPLAGSRRKRLGASSELSFTVLTVCSLAQANFYLLHVSLLREYLNLEFGSLATELPFEYDLERIIDDFILMAIFVGNDFLPNLPDLHINEGALERIWAIYKAVLPKAGKEGYHGSAWTDHHTGGYLNEHGEISLPRLQLMLDELAKFEVDNYEAEFADQNWFKGKQQKEIEAMEKARKRGKLGTPMRRGVC